MMQLLLFGGGLVAITLLGGLFLDALEGVTARHGEHIRRKYGPTPPSSLTPAEQEKMRRIGADVGSGRAGATDYIADALRRERKNN